MFGSGAPASLNRAKRYLIPHVPRPMHIRLVLIGAAMIPGVLHGQPAFPIRYGTPTVHARDLELGRLAGSVLSSDGSVYLTDIDNAVVLKFKPDGELAWRKGRRGDGPGEFQVPYRLAAHPRGDLIAVYDLAKGAISRLTADGVFIDRRVLPFPFTQVDGMLIFEDGSTILVGVTSYGGTARDRAVHLFDDSLRHVRSFGPLPPVEDREVLSYWGAGGISLALDGSILYTQRLPYRIFQYTPAGELIREIVPPFELDERPDQAVIITRNAGRFSVEEGRPVTRPITARQLPNGLIMSGRLNPATGRWIDVFSGSGDYIGSAPATNEWQIIFGVDGARGVGWAIGMVDFEPVLFRVPLHY